MNGERNTRQSAGFTLIELVVVLAVLAALGAVIIPQVQQLQEQARIRALASELASAAEDSFAVQLREPDGWPNQWMVDKKGNDHICAMLNNPEGSLASPDQIRSDYGIDAIPAGYTIVPATEASEPSITFNVPNAAGRGKDSNIVSVTCAMVED